MPGPIVAVDENFEGRSAAEGADWKRTYKRVFGVQTASAGVGSQAVRLAVPVAIGDPYSTDDPTFGERDDGSFCNSIEAAAGPGDDGREWTVTATYGPFDPSVYPANPLKHPIEASWDFAEFQKIVDETVDDPPDPIVNTAGDYFDPPVEIDDSRPVLSLSRNEATFDPLLAGDMKDSINTGLFLKRFQPFTVKCVKIAATWELDPNIGRFWKVNYEFSINPDLWKKTILNQGMRQLSVGTGGAPGTSFEHILQKGGPITAPVPLDDLGRALPAEGVPIFLTFRVYKERDFEIFNFPPLPV